MYTIYPPEVRHGDHDMNHAAPGTSYHTQSTSSYPPWGYSGSLLIDFLEGSWLNWTEAEAGCAGPFEELCTVGSVLDADTIGTIADYSGAAVMMVEGTDGEGTLWCDDLPADLPAGGPITATAILVARSITATSDDSPLLTLNYVEGDNLVLEAFTVGEFLPEGETDLDEAIDQYRATTLEFVPTDVSQGVLCAQVHGDATIYLDSIVYAYAD